MYPFYSYSILYARGDADLAEHILVYLSLSYV